jgi:hypothetical protein
MPKDKPGDGEKERTPEEDEELFVRGLRQRGEAVKKTKSGKLPPGATHEIVEDAGEPDAQPKVKRRRFSSF